MTDDKVTPFYHSLNGNMEEDKKLLEPFKYILQHCGKTDGKHICVSKFVPALNYWFKISSDKLQEINDIITMTCFAFVLVDDIQDNATFRDNFPTTHHIYGICNTLNASSYMPFITLEKIMNLHPEAIKIYIEEMMECYRGQGMDMFWKEYFICPTEEEYKIMAIRKAGWIFKLGIRLMKLFSTHEGDFSSLINVVGFYYQIHNDYCNLWVGEDTNDRVYCDDISEGKFSYLIIHALKNNPDDKQILNILKQRTTDINMKHYFLKLLENYGSFKYTRDVLEELDKMLRIEINRVGDNPLFVKVLDEYKDELLKKHVCAP